MLDGRSLYPDHSKFSLSVGPVCDYVYVFFKYCVPVGLSYLTEIY